MKRLLLAVFLVAFCAFSWYTVLSDSKTGNEDYEFFLSAAQEAYEKKIYADAEENYKKALSRRPKDEAALKGLALTYFAEEKYKESAEVCEKILTQKPDEEEILLLESDCFFRTGKYKKALSLLEGISKTDEIKEKILDIKSKYSLKYMVIENPSSFDVCSESGLSLSTVYENGKASAYNAKGVRAAHGDVSFLGGVSDDGILFPAVQDGESCFVDKDGNRKLVPDEKYDSFGPFCGELAVFQKEGMFGYVDKTLTEQATGFEAAYNFKDGQACVKAEGLIRIVDTSFQTTVQTEYTGAVSDEYGYIDHFGISVFIKDGIYYLCHANGESIGGFTAEYIGLPAEEGGLVPFKSGGLYGFADSQAGEVRIAPAYEEAKAFALGLAPVKQNGKWGFTDTDGVMVVEPVFDFASPLSEAGTAWIRNEAGFALLSFYYLNEEE